MSFEGALERLDGIARTRLEAARSEERPFSVTYMVNDRALAIGYHPSLGDYGVHGFEGAYLAECRGRQGRGATPDEALLDLCLKAMGPGDCLLIPPLLP